MIGDLLEGIGRMVLQPVEDALDLVEGLTEGEIRERAALRLGGAVVAAMTTAEVVSWFKEYVQCDDV